MAAQVHPARGMRDFLPEAKARREHALATIRNTYAQHGFDEIETPVMEDFERLHAGLGGDNEKLSFSVLRRGLDADDLTAAVAANSTETLTDLGLRFDLTVPLARFYASHRAELPGVFRSIQIAPVWRAERPQKGRYRQFVQADIDIIGEPGILAEIELITATSATLEALGLSGCTIRINDRRVLSSLLSWAGFSDDQQPTALIEIDKRDKIGTDRVVELLSTLNPDAASRIGEVLTSIEAAQARSVLPLTEEAMRAVLPEAISEEAVASLTTLGSALQSLPAGVTVEFDPTLVRGMGYYTGTIFEIAHPDSGSSIGGGGRYDGMIGRFLGDDVPAAGFSIGFERIIDLIEVGSDAHAKSIVLVYDKDANPADLASVKTDFLAHGFRVRLERRSKNVTAQLEKLTSQGYSSFVLVDAGVNSSANLQVKPLTAG
jgi:histidyl-tRNA synthetase